jgi:superfamily II DNA or RNA helicase
MTRDELQSKATDILEEKKRLICMWATGTGKSRVVLNFVERHPQATVLILVPEQNNIQNWRDEFYKFNITDWNVQIICYASFHKQLDTAWDLVVFDEAPHVDTDLRKAICRSVRGKHILALGAVLSDEERQTLESIYGKFVVSHVPLSKAISLGYLPMPEINILHITLDNTKRTHMYNGQRMTAKEKYDILQANVKKATNAFNVQSSYPNKMKMLKAGSVRKRFLGEMKEDAIRRICRNLEANERRFLCFCSSIKQAELLGMNHAFTSKTPVSFKLLERFNSGEINSLYVVGKLIEGQNLNNIECGVLGQLGGTDRITVQSLGRILRAEKPRVFVPIFDDTKDEGFLRTLTDNVPNEYIKHYKF